jgi:signal transduction histidine kinase
MTQIPALSSRAATEPAQRRWMGWTPYQWMHLFAGMALLIMAFDLSRSWGWLGSLISRLAQNPRLGNLVQGAMAGWSSLPAIALTLAVVWIRRKVLERGPSWLAHLALAACLSWMALSVGEFAQGAHDGFIAGYYEGAELARQDRAAQGLPPKPTVAPPTWEVHRADQWVTFTSWIILSSIGAVVLHRMERHRRESERQQGLAREAQNAAWRAKVAPHFIFNALNTLHAQIEKDPKAAQSTTENLAHLFRQVVTMSDRPTVPLKEELAFVESYLGIEKARMGDRLRVTVDVPEELEEILIPPLSLQVLVENAIKHGVAPREAGGEVRIGAQISGKCLEVFVKDSGDGTSGKEGTGTGLATLQQRLMRPEDLRLERVPTGFRASFLWPLS